MGQHTRFWYLWPLIYAHANISSKASGLNYGLSLLHPYFVYTCEQRRLWQVCTNEPLLLTNEISMDISCTRPNNKPVHENCIQERLRLAWASKGS